MEHQSRDRQLNLTEQLRSLGPAAAAEDVLGAFEDWTATQGITLYAAQEDAVLALLTGANVVMATPTGSGKSLVAVAAHARAVAAGERSWYTAPIKALVSEKFFALCAIFGADNVGMMTGDAAVNPEAPIICATAEVLANQALRQRNRADIGVVVMDEFHFYAEPDRGWAWQVPLLLMPQTQFVLMSATLGDTTAFEKDLTGRNGRDTVAITSAERPVPLHFDWAMSPIHETIEELLADGKSPVYVVHFTQQAAVERALALMSVNVCSTAEKAAIRDLVGHFRFGKGFGETLKRLVLHGIGVHHAGLLPKYRRLVETLAQAGLLKVICGTDTLGVGINVPIRAVLLTSLAKYDGRRQRILRAREFHQIAGRAGRAGFDTEGFVVVQAPDHVIENARALAKAGDDPKKRRRVNRKGPPEGVLSYTEATYDRLVGSAPEALRSRMRVTHAMLLNILDEVPGQGDTLRIVLSDNHEDPSRFPALVHRAAQIIDSLDRAGVVEPLPQTPGYAVPELILESIATEAVGAGGAGGGDERVTDTQDADADPAPPDDRALLAVPELRGEPAPELPDEPDELGDAPTETDQLPPESLAPESSAPESALDVAATLATAYRVTEDLQHGFALNQPLSAFALAALELLDPESPDYALDVLSVIEATLEDPRVVLMAQQFEARGTAVQEMKADGLEYEERMELLDDVTWPKPLEELLTAAFTIYRQSHPWVYAGDLSPKSVVRHMYEGAMTFGEFVQQYKLARAEGIVLRYLTDCYRAMRQTVPTSARTDEVDDLIEWLGELVRQTDSSLLDEWEALANPVEDGVAVRPVHESRGLSANPRALRVMIRRAMFRRVELLALRRYAALAALDDGMSVEDWEDDAGAYFEEYADVGTGPQARGPAFFALAEGREEWVATQIIDDPDGDRDWRITAILDLAATDEAGELVLATHSLAPADDA